jgi:hypothetical protein
MIFSLLGNSFGISKFLEIFDFQDSENHNLVVKQVFKGDVNIE